MKMLCVQEIKKFYFNAHLNKVKVNLQVGGQNCVITMKAKEKEKRVEFAITSMFQQHYIHIEHFGE